ncbi:DUF4411 family protein [Flavobacterium sp.]|jgi:hypothetical protein|uniref:DUF4411 family protein n=1 Tax=Flavobacterium sp. TaxID=239 RepID=UPI0037BF7B36
MEIFIVDSNFFIQAHRSIYPLDIALGFWNKVKQLAHAGLLFSIDKVKDELYDKNDELEVWCKNNLPENFFIDSSTAIAQYAIVSAWAISKNDHYLPNALNEFLDASEADAFLVSFALADPVIRIIVTQEVSRPEQKNKIKIPEPCIALGINYLNTIAMFRKLGETF